MQNEFRLAERARGEYKSRTALQLQQHLEILERKAAAKHEKSCKMISHILDDILDLSFKIAEYQELNGSKEIPPKLLRGWKTLLLHEKPIYKPFVVAIEDYPPVSKKPDLDPNILSTVDILDEDELNDYLLGKNDWAYFGDNK